MFLAGTSVLYKTALCVVCAGFIFLIVGLITPSGEKLTFERPDVRITHNLFTICANVSTPEICHIHPRTPLLCVLVSCLLPVVYATIRKDATTWRRVSLILVFTTGLFILSTGVTFYRDFNSVTAVRNMRSSAVIVIVGGICFFVSGIILLINGKETIVHKEETDFKSFSIM